MKLSASDQRLFAFSPDPDIPIDKSGSTHQAITAAGLALAEVVAEHVSGPGQPMAAVVEIANAVQYAHEEVARGHRRTHRQKTAVHSDDTPGTVPAPVVEEAAAQTGAELPEPEPEPVPETDPVASEDAHDS